MIGQGNDWRAIFRVVGKAALLFILLNVIFAALNPMEELGRLSLYNWLLPDTTLREMYCSFPKIP